LPLVLPLAYPVLLAQGLAPWFGLLLVDRPAPTAFVV